MQSSKAYRARLARILGDELYGPRLARLDRRDTGHVLTLLHRGDGAQARSEILRLDAARRARETEQRTDRSRRQVGEHLLAELHTVVTLRPPNPATIAVGVSVMTTSQRAIALTLTGDQIQRGAGNEINIQWYESLATWHNPWWYH